jgi:ABC-type dipeptide/oligopeptide/nickel transport system ATPase component
MTAPVVVAHGLSVEIPVDGGTTRPVDGVDLEVNLGDTVALIGPSGSGKSLTARALMGIAPRAAGSTPRR